MRNNMGYEHSLVISSVFDLSQNNKTENETYEKYFDCSFIIYSFLGRVFVKKKKKTVTLSWCQQGAPRNLRSALYEIRRGFRGPESAVRKAERA